MPQIDHSAADINASVQMNTEQSSLQLLPTGFDLRVGYEESLGTLEYCLSASSGVLYEIDHDQVFTKLTSQTTFGDGSTALADRTFAIRPSDGETDYSYYYNGIKVTKTAIETVQHTDADGSYFIGFGSDGNLLVEASVYDAIMKDVACAIVTANTTNTEKIVFANERHGLQMDSITHKEAHETVGARWANVGLEIEGLANNGTDFTKITAGAFYEDIKHSVAEVETAPFVWRDGTTGWRISAVDDLLGYKVGAKVQYNLDTTGTWSIEDIGSDYILCHFFATNDAEFPFFKLLGQTLYANRGEARDKIFQEIATLKTNGLPTPEMVHIGSCIVHNESTGQIEKGSDDEIWIDFRSQQFVPRY